ncbi:2TM domain-containing protein [Flavobacterium sp. LC2016-01]|uniref:2TM domain-containing protein n=1 Tax=Flavobacterium sp. LC2016-01 TaxID=2675876 RepID=UPI0012BAA358|nr:2TM domain-containing protein [Flavobacterium sp. LC2016-01]MTH15728.1 hypothetical protein [Flavobacterium sp. LC2016-01]
MGCSRRRMYEEYRKEFKDDESFEIAYKKVKKVKDFYSHLKVYIVVNVILIISNTNRDFLGIRFNENELFDWETYSTAIFWGIALLVHALAVFGPELFFGSNWEQRKIQSYMDKEAHSTHKWQ